jgi:capsular polysaccharide transport system permease protein
MIMKYLKRVNRLFLLTVVMPTAIAGAYFGLVASDQYTSVSSFLVRSPQQTSATGISGLLKGVGGFSQSDGDAYTVQKYLLSRDAMTVLDSEQHIKSAFQSGAIDFVNRFGLFGLSDSIEEFYRYYGENIVDAKVDTESPIVTLNIHAYDPHLAWSMNKRLLELSERIVNQMNERARSDLINTAQHDVDVAKESDRKATLALAQYRNNAGVIDPERQSTIPLQQVGKLQDDLITTRVQIAQMERLSPENPGLPNLRDRANLLQQAIDQVSQRVAGEHGGSLASKAAEFQHLTLEKDVADKILAGAITLLDQARVEAERKQLYLERISQPSLPDEAMSPRRGRAILATFVLGLILWGVLTIVIGGVKEHYDR